MEPPSHTHRAPQVRWRSSRMAATSRRRRLRPRRPSPRAWMLVTPPPPVRSGGPCLQVPVRFVYAFAFACAAGGQTRLTTGRPMWAEVTSWSDLLGQFGPPNDRRLKGLCPMTTDGKENSTSSPSLHIPAHAVAPQVRRISPWPPLPEPLNRFSQGIECADAYGRTCVNEN